MASEAGVGEVKVDLGEVVGRQVAEEKEESKIRKRARPHNSQDQILQNFRPYTECTHLFRLLLECNRINHYSASDGNWQVYQRMIQAHLHILHMLHLDHTLQSRNYNLRK